MHDAKKEILFCISSHISKYKFGEFCINIETVFTPVSGFISESYFIDRVGGALVET